MANPPSWTLVPTLWGIVGVAGDADALWYVGYPESTESAAVEQLAEEIGELGGFDPGHLGWVEGPLRDYFMGRSIHWDVLPARLIGTPFQVAVWAATRRIPHGETRSYGDVAFEAGFPRAHRAAGSALAANPAGLLVPCHRVIAASGLGGYGRWLNRKRALLRLEGLVVERLTGGEAVRPRRRVKGQRGEERRNGGDGEDREG